MKWFSKTLDKWDEAEQENYIRFKRIFSLEKLNNVIMISEECDMYFKQALSPEQTIEMLQEAIDWIKENS